MIIESQFRSAWWLPGGHLQTIWPNRFRFGPRIELTRERLELPDGDFVDLSWAGPVDGPIVCLVHGLTGTAQTPHIAGMLSALTHRGWRAVLLHFRGCSGEPNRQARSYHCGETEDLDYVLGLLAQRHPGVPMTAVGFSLGGNVLLKYLGEKRQDTPLHAAVAVSVPLLLSPVAKRLDEGFAKVYQRIFLTDLKRKARSKQALLEQQGISVELLSKVHTLVSFDEQITAPVHGFANADDYYERASSRPYLRQIERPTLIIQSINDPMMPRAVIPTEAELSSEVVLELARHGGHVGFVAGAIPGRARYWLDERIPDYLDAWRIGTR